MNFAETQYGKFYYLPNDDIGQRIARGEFHDRHFKPWMDNLGAGDTLIDVGANIGFFSIYAAKRGAQVWAFEPNILVYELLKKNVVANGCDGVGYTNIALYDSETKLTINPEWNGGQHMTAETSNSGGLSLVKGDGDFDGVALDNWLAAMPIKKVSLLKIDTQGSDYRVLLGARKTIEKHRPVICFEFEHNGSGLNANGDSIQDFVKFFAEIDYVVRWVADSMYGSDYVVVPA